MLPSKRYPRLLERQVSKTIIRYIDSAITAPLKHQPFQKDDRMFSGLFSEFWQEHLMGIDLEHIYESKSDDPSWLSYYSNHAINSVRLVLAVRERNKNSPTLQGQPSPPLTLDSVTLKNVSHETFGQILHVLAEANEHLRLSEELGSHQASHRIYEEFKLAASNINLRHHYERKPDDPEWLARYSDQAINTVRLAMAVRARHGSTYHSHPYRLPVSVLSLDTVVLNDLTPEKFLDIFHQIVEAGRHAKKDDINNNGNTPFNPDGATMEHSGNDGASEDSESEQDPDAFSEIDYGSDSTLHNAETVDDGIVDFELEEEFKQALEKWDANEAREDLPEDIIGPLLDSPKTRKITVSILRRALGVAKASNTVFKKDVDCILRELRREYRIAHTQPFLYRMITSYERPITPLIYGYLVLSSSAHILRSHCRPSQRTAHTPTVSNLLTGLDTVKKDLIAIIEDLNDFPDFQEIMLERVRITNIRLDVYQDTIGHCIEIGSKLQDIYFFEGPANKPHITLQHENCRKLWIAIEVFMQYDEARFGKEYFQEFPGCLVKACGIMTLLRDVIDLKYLPACTQNEYLIKAVDGAKGLLKKWHQRSVKSENSLYVALQ